MDISTHRAMLTSRIARRRRDLRGAWNALSPQRHPNLWFWGTAFVLNAILLLPFYMLQPATWGLLPHGDLSLHDLLVRREHGDILRLNAEWTLALALRAFWPQLRGREPRWTRGLIASYFVIAVTYQVYAGAMIGLYHSAPNFYNDYPFIVGGIRFVLESLNVPVGYYVLGTAAMVTAAAFIGMLLRVLLWTVAATRLTKATRMVLLALAIAVVGEGIFYKEGLADPYMVVNSITAEVIENVRGSLRSRREVSDLMQIDPYPDYDYAQYSLRKRPDIYLIFVESYGSVLYSEEYYKDAYTSLLRNLQSRLEERGWHMVSTLSVAPTWGGGSWMSYTSTMFGLCINQQQAYLALRSKYQSLPYPNLGRYLRSQGYEYVWVAPIARRLAPADDEQNRRFYGAERWITFSNLDYHGPLYGWGPSPPDQYTLGYIAELGRKARHPLFVFFLTQSSHYPWVPLAPVVDDWRTLAHANLKGGTLSEEEQERTPYVEEKRNYRNAIAYELNMLSDFVLSLGDKDAIVVLMGDHQPPAITARSDGYETIVHILSRDPQFVKGFERYGFTAGLTISSPRATMRHEGFYSMFVRELVARYGHEPHSLPPYLPRGLSGRNKIDAGP